MTGREKIEAAFSPRGTPAFAAVVAYPELLFRDHARALSERPWWHRQSPDLDVQAAWYRDALGRTGMDWFDVRPSHPRLDRERFRVEERGAKVALFDPRANERRPLPEPVVAGAHHAAPPRLAASEEEVAQQVPPPPPFEVAAFLASGEADLALRLAREHGTAKLALLHASAPLWRCYGTWGFEGLMEMTASRPDLVESACRRFMDANRVLIRRAAALGAEVVWFEDALTDLLSPRSFASLNLPFLREMADAIRRNGMRSIHYFCGNPEGKWDSLLATGADALALEESKKGFTVDITEVADRVKGRMVLLGNLDAVGVLQDGSEADLHREIARQLEAGRRNGGRFLMCLGSPVTPSTPVARVRRFCEIAHELSPSP
jgi:hypothetical protein